MFDDEDHDETIDERPDPPAALARYVAPAAAREDPSMVAWPPSLPIELALKVEPVSKICEDYGITRADWQRLKENPVFVAELGRAVELVRIDGVGFKARARLQANELLKTSWNLIHDRDTPPAVKARLIQGTVQWAGLDASQEAAAASKGGVNAGFQIIVNLGDR